MRPGEAILRILAEAATTLERSFKGRGAEEAADEYLQYWHSERHAWSLVPRLGRAGTRTLDLYKASRSDRTIPILSASGKISGWAIGRASCSESGCPYVSLSVVAVSFKKTISHTYTTTVTNDTHPTSH